MERSDYLRKIILPALIVLGICLILFSTALSLGNTGTNSSTAGNNTYTVTVTPVNSTSPVPFQTYSSIRITVEGVQNFTSVSISFSGNNAKEPNLNYTFSPRPYFLAYVPFPSLINNSSIAVNISNTSEFHFPIRNDGSYFSLLPEITLFSGIITIAAAIYYSRISDRWILLLVPLYFVMSAFYGQRYDDYYLISAGFRTIFGVNPYVSSAQVPPGLQWAYPPGYVPWSSLVALLYVHLPGTTALSNASLNYVGTQFGDFYGSWRALASYRLILLYFLIKIPLVASFFWVALSLRRLTGSYQMKLWILNPIAIIVGIMWGQTDVLAVALMLQAVVYHRNGKPFQSVLFASLGASVKVFPFLLVPYLIFHSRRRLAASLGILPVLLYVLAVYSFSGGVFNSVLGLLFARSVPTYEGVFISNGMTWQVLVTALGIQHFPSLFIFFFLPAYAVLTAFALKGKMGLELYGILSFLLLFISYNFVNPQYMIWIIPLLIIYGNRRWAVMISVLAAGYMALTYSYTYFLNPEISWNYQSSIMGQIESLRLLVTGSTLARIVIGFISTGIFAFMLYSLTKSLRGRRESNIDEV